MSEHFFIKELPNGMTLLGQRMDQVSSASIALVVPAGASHDRDTAEGSAAIACEWCLKGAGDRTTRQLNDALDSLGCQHQETVQSEQVILSAAQLGRNLPDVLRIFSDIVRRPRLDDGTFDTSKALIVQDLAALEDEPAQKCNVLLRENFYPFPLGRCIYGKRESLESMSSEAVRRHVQDNFTPDGTILAVAGNIEWEAFCDLADQCFGDWSGGPSQPVATTPPAAGVTHLPKESAQAHIALAHRSVPISHQHYYAARMAETVLSVGMSSRLFTEVREKRGLAYHVSSHYHSLKDHAGMLTYAGTPPERAQETFDVTVGELRRLGEGVEADEMSRARTQLKSSLIMQGESTAARASALAGDWLHLKRLRSLPELSQAIDSVTADDVMAYLHDFPAEDFTVLIIGPQPVDTSALDK